MATADTKCDQLSQTPPLLARVVHLDGAEGRNDQRANPEKQKATPRSNCIRRELQAMQVMRVRDRLMSLDEQVISTITQRTDAGSLRRDVEAFDDRR